MRLFEAFFLSLPRITSKQSFTFSSRALQNTECKSKINDACEILLQYPANGSKNYYGSCGMRNTKKAKPRSESTINSISIRLNESKWKILWCCCPFCGAHLALFFFGLSFAHLKVRVYNILKNKNVRSNKNCFATNASSELIRTM